MKHWQQYNSIERLHDLEKIMDTDFGLNALSDGKLYMDIVNHRSIYNKIPHVDYDSHHPQRINFLPPASVIKEWESDYNKMKENFIYDMRKMSFENLMNRIIELQECVRNMNNVHESMIISE